LLTGDFTNYRERNPPGKVVGEMAMLRQLKSLATVLLFRASTLKFAQAGLFQAAMVLGMSFRDSPRWSKNGQYIEANGIERSVTIGCDSLDAKMDSRE
jgi:hypothetical protein